MDKQVYVEFADFSIAGVDFGLKIKKDYPDITKENYESYIDDFYLEKQESMEQSVRELQEKIDSTQDAFFEAVMNVFKKDFSNNDFMGALSIFDCNPRYPEKNLFQIYYRRDLLGKMEVVYHETMHFLFFQFCSEQCADFIKEYNPNNGPYWKLSEIFNVIILNQPAFQNILEREEGLFYPELQDALEIAKEIWIKGDGDVRYFVENMLKHI
ncbi:MAG: hypothetical protein WAU28_02100 [Candidatus Moraniibacteriota bacterium]